MIRYLAIFLSTSLVGLVLWLPGRYAPADFYRALRLDHTACSEMWGTTYADGALTMALSMSENKPSASPRAKTMNSRTPESQAAKRLGEVISRVAAQRYFGAVEAMTTLAFYRLAMMWHLASGATVLLIAALVDAAIRRTIRMHELRQHDPERVALALAGCMTSLIILAALLVTPIALSPILFASAMLAASYFIHVAVANYRRDSA